MAINETRAVSVTLEADLAAPGFLPLIDLAPGNIVIPNQSQLTVTGTPSPLEVAVMLCAPGTVLGTPAEGATLEQSEVFNVTSGKVFVLEGNVPPLAQGGVLGLYVPVALLTVGAKVEGVLSIVR
jgi:hypothetical protein